MRSSVLVLVALAAVVSGCGGGSSDAKDSGKTVQDAIEDTPQCSDVWKVGATLDLNTYEGCQASGDEFVVAVTRGCYDAKSNYIGQFATLEDRLWVVQTGTDKNGKGGTPGKVTDVDPKC